MTDAASSALTELIEGPKRRSQMRCCAELSTMRQLRKSGLISLRGHDWTLTDTGRKMAEQIKESQQ